MAVDGTASAWQHGQLTEAERAFQAGIERRASGGVYGRLTWVVIEKPGTT